MMNDELKSTLEWLKTCGNNDYIFETGNSRMLLIYITNLQQRVKQLRDELLDYELQNSRLQKEVVNLRVNAGKSVF